MTKASLNECIGRTGKDEEVHAFTLCAGELEARVMTYGATLMALRTPDRTGRVDSIILGFDTLDPYLAGTPYFGATIGRYANRIAHARFTLDGIEHRLSANEGENQLHGGACGFDKRVWRVSYASAEEVTFNYRSVDGEEGFPGEVCVEATYALTPRSLTITYRASASEPTPINLTNHSYYNLSGSALAPITEHLLSIDAQYMTPVDAALIPTGEIRAIGGTPFDFQRLHAIGARIDADDPQLRIGGGYDHNFVLNKPAPRAFTPAATLAELRTGRRMELWTTEPGLQFYSGNYLDGSLHGRHGAFHKRTGLCLEPQHFPDSPNQPAFPSTILRPGERYLSRTELRFSAD